MLFYTGVRDPVLSIALRCAVPQVSETEREDLEESEKVQHWVERLCQTRLEQISCVENESPEVHLESLLFSVYQLGTPVVLSHRILLCVVTFLQSFHVFSLPLQIHRFVVGHNAL